MPANRDLTITGGGLAGLSLALQCRQELPDARITVIEKRQHPVPEAAHKVGESTVEAAAHYFGEMLGLKDHIVDQQLPKFGLRFFFPAGDNSQIDQRLELGGTLYAHCPSYQLDRGRFENYLGDLCLERDIEFLDRAEVSELNVGAMGRPHRVSFRQEDRAETLTTRWLVDASGRRALLKRELNLQLPSPHRASSAWFRFKKHLRVDDWSSDPAWQGVHQGEKARFFSTNHLMGQGYWVWLIPLASGSTSVGIVAADEFHSLSDFNTLEKAVEWLEKHEPQCADVVKANQDSIQDFRAIKHYAVESKQVYSANRWGITGEAGFFHDPFYSPGSDFIAFSNTFLTDLIRRDLSGGGFRIRAFAYDKIYKKFYSGTAAVYQDQYKIFGNPQVMPVKVLWDYFVYWSITAYIFMQGRLCRQTCYMRMLKPLSRYRKLNHFMQSYFRKWAEQTNGEAVGEGYVDISSIPLVRQWNRQLVEQISDGQFVARFNEHLEQLETLAEEIVEHAGVPAEFPYRFGPRSASQPNGLQKVFQPQARTPSEAAEDQGRLQPLDGIA